MSLPNYGRLPSTPEPVRLSFKCRTFGIIPHQPCSGTTDDGTDTDCECECHGT